MARADLLVSLVKASAEGDRGRVRKTTEAIIAEERAKNHHVLADRLTRAVANGEASPRAAFVGGGRAWRRFATELVPRRRLEDVVLSDANRAACRDLIEEQRRASVLMQVDGLPSYTVTVAATNHPELLDRAVWRRFQLRLSLGAPTERDLARYLEKFSRSMGGGLGHAPASLAARLGPVSYAEAEEFCLD